jgi:NitT/TauT family transport system substrate-binding protein
VKGAITPSVKAMLAKEGLIEGTDYQTVLLDGFDPKVHIEVPDIVGFPGYKSNEPLQLTAAGLKFTVYDPSDFGIPGSFGIVYTNRTFLQQFPTAAVDFMRATMKGLADAIADPKAAAAIAVDAINANGNTMFLSPEGETARWAVESELVGGSSSPEQPAGLPLLDLLQAEVDTYAGIGLFADGKPTVADLVDPSVLEGVYATDGSVIWPTN